MGNPAASETPLTDPQPPAAAPRGLFHRTEFWSAVALVVFFFLPWTSVASSAQSGLDLVMMGSDAAPSSEFAGAYRALRLLLGAVPILAAWACLRELTGASQAARAKAHILAGAVPLIALIVAFALLRTGLFDVIDFGMVGTVVCAGICLGRGSQLLADESPLAAAMGRIWDQVRPLGLLVLVMCMIRSSAADWNDVPTGSMKPSIVEGDRIFVNKLAYDLKLPFSTWRLASWGAPKQGEVVVFLNPDTGIRLVKRCVGVPGDTIEVRPDDRISSGVLYVNGVKATYGPLDPKYKAAIDPYEQSQFSYWQETMPGGRRHPVLAKLVNPNDPRRYMAPRKLGPDQFFMMGDNRDNSADSRFFSKPVTRNLILGHATAVAFSLDLNHHWVPRWSRFFTMLP